MCIPARKPAYLHCLLVGLVCGYLNICNAETRHPLTNQALSGEEIKSVLIGNSVFHSATKSDSSYKVSFPEYGILIGSAGPFGLFKDKGSWSVSNGIYCAQWNHWQDKQTLCYRVYLDKDTIVWVSMDGQQTIKDRLLPGP